MRRLEPTDEVVKVSHVHLEREDDMVRQSGMTGVRVMSERVWCVGSNAGVLDQVGDDSVDEVGLVDGNVLDVEVHLADGRLKDFKDGEVGMIADVVLEFINGSVTNVVVLGFGIVASDTDV